MEYRKIARLMLGLAFPALACEESSPDLLELVTTAQDDRGPGATESTNFIELLTFVPFAVHSVHDDEG
jgi:hypothetical protein